MKVFNSALKIIERLVDDGHVAYFAGGWVRDFLMGYPSDDIDIATSAHTKQIQALFEKTIPVGISFGIIIVVIDGIEFEIASFRKEDNYQDGRRPSRVEKATPQEDAMRRDFTINGMFYDPIEKKLYDYVQGQADIKNKLIRAIGNPEDRFQEDRLRMMRAARYATRFKFSIEEKTKNAILSQAKTLLPSVSAERIWHEFKKMMQFAHFENGMVMLHELKLLPTIFPVLSSLQLEDIRKKCAPIRFFPASAPPIAELMQLFYHLDKDTILDQLNFLKLSNKEKEFALFAIESEKLFLKNENILSIDNRYTWAKFFAANDAPTFTAIFLSRFPADERDALLKRYTNWEAILSSHILRLKNKSPLVRADDLIKLGITPGKKMGELLDLAEKNSISRDIEDKNILLHEIKKIIF